MATFAPSLLTTCNWLQACQLGTALCSVLLDIQDVSVQEPLLAAVVSIFAVPELAALLQTDRPSSAGGSNKCSGGECGVLSESSRSKSGGVTVRQQFMQAALSAATNLISVSGLEPVLLRLVTALVRCQTRIYRRVAPLLEYFVHLMHFCPCLSRTQNDFISSFFTLLFE
jgi:hypothetical protein